MKNSRQKRTRDGKLIKQQKRVYIFWWKFLEIALKENRKINREKYRGWSLKDIENGMKFDVWWEKHWEKLFSIKKEGDSPKVKTSVEETVPKAYKTRLKVYQLRKKGLSHKQIINEIDTLARSKRKGEKYYGMIDSNSQQSSREALYFANKHLKNVCNGKFP